MFRKHLYILGLIFLSTFGFSKSIEFDDKTTESNTLSDLQVNLETDKTVFNYRDPIQLRVSILNTGDEVELSIHPRKGYFNYYIEVFSKEGVSIPEKDAYFAERFNDLEELKKKQVNTTQNPLTNEEGFRTIHLISDKIIGDQINLAEIFDLKPGYYLVRAKFYPKTLLLDPLSYIYSPFIQVIIKPEKREQEKELMMKQNWDHDKGLLRTPEDSVMAFFNAKAEGNWDKFFYVLDLRQLITIFAGFNESYEKGSSDEKDAVLMDFRNYLKDINAHEKIRSVEIEETTIRKDQALVKVLLQTEVEHRLLSREYTFKLVQQNNWMITAYTVMVR